MTEKQDLNDLVIDTQRDTIGQIMDIMYAQTKASQDWVDQHDQKELDILEKKIKNFYDLLAESEKKTPEWINGIIVPVYIFSEYSELIQQINEITETMKRRIKNNQDLDKLSHESNKAVVQTMAQQLKEAHHHD